MRYKRYENIILARIDRDEEILEQLKSICHREKIRLASISALGAVKEFTAGVFLTGPKKYKENHFKGDFEIVSLIGTVNTMDGKYYAHLHMSAGDATGHVFGGHLNRAVVSATCEMTIQIIDGTLDRKYSGEIGLNLYEF